MQTNGENLYERREFKYLLPRRLVPYVRAAAQAACRLDGNAGPDGLYRIRSLYFDTEQLHLYNANQHERGDRFKLRVRCYPRSNQVSGPVFLEVKRRVQDVVVKHRGALPAHAWADLIRHPDRLASTELTPRARLAAERFLALVHTYHLVPVILVEYVREAYVSLLDDYARLTFDLQITCQPGERLSLEADAQAWHPVDHLVQTRSLEPTTLLELKFGGAAPRWMMNLVQKLELQRYSFSKYCYSVTQQRTLPLPRVAVWASED